MTRIACLFLLVACSAAQRKPGDCSRPIRHTGELSACEGQVVTLIGRVSRSKQPTLLGVDVDAEYALTDGPELVARGTLQRYTIEPTPADARMAMASKGPGTYWSLIDDGKLATARRR